MQFNIGDKVKWTYLSYGNYGPGTGESITLYGQVVEVVPPGQLPSKEYEKYPGVDNLNRRNVESYIINTGKNILRPSIKLESYTT